VSLTLHDDSTNLWNRLSQSFILGLLYEIYKKKGLCGDNASFSVRNVTKATKPFGVHL